jgi:hypothetical protein
MAKRIFLQGLVAGLLSSVAGVTYHYIYQATLDVHFDKIINPGSITGASVFGCMLISICYFVFYKYNKLNLMGWLNVSIAILSFISIISPISMNLPLEIETPELFPGLVVPMHLFPALAFFAINPFFVHEQVK